MANLCIVIYLLSQVINQCFVSAYSSEPIAILPSLEVRPRLSTNYLPSVNPPHARIDSRLFNAPQQHFYQRNSISPTPAELRESYENFQPEQRSEDINSTKLINDFLRAIGVEDDDDQETGDSSRPLFRDDHYSPYPQMYPVPAQQASYGQNRPNYAPVPPSVNYNTPTYLQPALIRHPTYKTLDLVKPFASKVSSKIGGLLSIVLALLGGSGGLSGLSGFKDILVNGIIKPLFTLKGGLKELISKLSIPVISLLLINVEVLLTIWWLWDDECPKVHAAPVYVQAPAPYQYVKPAPAPYQYPKPQPVYNY